MTERLKKALEQFPEVEQDQIAELLLETIAHDDSQWEAAFAASRNKLEKLRSDALREYRAGEITRLDIEKLLP